MSTDLKSLENESIYIIREAYSAVKTLAMLWSMGKDSTVMLHLVRKAFVGNIPFPLLHIDTTYKIPEMIAWRDEYVRRTGVKLIVAKNDQALSEGMGAERGRLACCGALKTEALMNAVREHKLQGLFLGIRKDEEGSRGKERIVSPRDLHSNWDYKNQPAEIWNYYNLHLPESVHVRIHPLLRWTEMDVWRYIEKENLDIMPLYFSNEGRRYRSLGCAPCTANIESNATTVREIIRELESLPNSERAGRAQDLEHTYAMQKLRSTGYM